MWRRTSGSVQGPSAPCNAGPPGHRPAALATPSRVPGVPPSSSACGGADPRAACHQQALPSRCEHLDCSRKGGESQDALCALWHPLASQANSSCLASGRGAAPQSRRAKPRHTFAGASSAFSVIIVRSCNFLSTEQHACFCVSVSFVNIRIVLMQHARHGLQNVDEDAQTAG